MRRGKEYRQRILDKIASQAEIKERKKIISDNCTMLTIDEVMSSNNLSNEFKVSAYHYFKSINKSKWWWQR